MPIFPGGPRGPSGPLGPDVPGEPRAPGALGTPGGPGGPWGTPRPDEMLKKTFIHSFKDILTEVHKCRSQRRRIPHQSLPEMNE